MTTDNISDEALAAFIDGNASLAESHLITEAILSDPEILETFELANDLSFEADLGAFPGIDTPLFLTDRSLYVVNLNFEAADTFYEVGYELSDACSKQMPDNDMPIHDDSIMPFGDDSQFDTNLDNNDFNNNDITTDPDIDLNGMHQIF